MRKRFIDSLFLSKEINEQLHYEIKTRAVVEDELRESEERYRNVVENSLVAFYIIQDNLFRFVNSRFCDITDYTYDEVVDKIDPLETTHPDDRKKVEENIRHRLEDKTISSKYEIRIIKKDQSIVTVKVIEGSFIYNGRIATFGTLIDITKEKLLEAKLLQAQKMEAVGTLAGGIAHDFNNILTALIGYGTILQMKMDTSEPLRRYADLILSASEKAINLTQSLLSFSRLQPVTLKPININNVIKGTEKLLRRVVTEDIRLVTDIAPEQINILADSTQIDQILFNLATNARDSMPKGGCLMITTKTADLDEEFIQNNGFGKKGRYAVLTVSDTGIGMDEDTMKRIFDPFFTTKEAGKGTGLGLSTVYGIVKQNHGYIMVHSKPGQGSHFHIYLPLIKDDVFEIQKAPINLRKGKETILVAEDNNEARSFIKDILEQYGYNVIEAVDGDEAVEKFKEHREISLIILDSIMPKKNGKEVYDIIKRLYPGVRTLFMSGYPKEVVLAKGVIEEGIEFISKPLFPEELLKKMGELLDGQELGIS